MKGNDNSDTHYAALYKAFGLLFGGNHRKGRAAGSCYLEFIKAQGTPILDFFPAKLSDIPQRQLHILQGKLSPSEWKDFSTPESGLFRTFQGVCWIASLLLSAKTLDYDHAQEIKLAILKLGKAPVADPAELVETLMVELRKAQGLSYHEARAMVHEELYDPLGTAKGKGKRKGGRDLTPDDVKVLRRHDRDIAMIRAFATLLDVDEEREAMLFFKMMYSLPEKFPHEKKLEAKDLDRPPLQELREEFSAGEWELLHKRVEGLGAILEVGAIFHEHDASHPPNLALPDPKYYQALSAIYQPNIFPPEKAEEIKHHLQVALTINQLGLPLEQAEQRVRSDFGTPS